MQLGALISGKYRLTRKLGEGTMAVVWAAVNETTSGEVALKLILRSTEELRLRLEKEAHSVGRLKHRNIIEIYDVGRTGQGDPYLVMPLLTGETLSDLLGRTRRLEPEVAAWIARDVARALATAHASNIVHRDLKPANIFLHCEPGDAGPIVKVLDFGVSKDLEVADGLTAFGRTVGSPAYMSPEQANMDWTLDHRADLWSLGVILFEMLTGVPLWKGNGNQILPQILTGEIPLVSRSIRDIDPALDSLVSRCLERDRGKRIGSAAEVIAELERFATQSQPVSAVGRSSVDWSVPVTFNPASGSERSPGEPEGWEDDRDDEVTALFNPMIATELLLRRPPPAIPAAKPELPPPPPSPPPRGMVGSGTMRMPFDQVANLPPPAFVAGPPPLPSPAPILQSPTSDPAPGDNALGMDAQQRRRVTIAMLIGLWVGLIGLLSLVIHTELSPEAAPPPPPTASAALTPTAKVAIAAPPPPTVTPVAAPELAPPPTVKPMAPQPPPRSTHTVSSGSAPKKSKKNPDLPF